jgi:thiamine transport system permease protein
VRKRITWILWLLPAAFLLVFYFQPLAAIFARVGNQTLAEGIGSFNLSRIADTLGFTLYQAFLSTILTLILGLPAAYIFARFNFHGKKLLRTLSTIPFILPTVVVAASLNTLLGPRGWANILLMNVFGLENPPIAFVNSLGAILTAHVFYNVSVIIRLVGTAWSQLDTRLNQAARVLGASSRKAFFEVTLPLLMPVILSATLLVFLFDFTSFGVVMLLGGPQNVTLEVEIYTQAMYLLNLPMAGVLSLIQLLMTLGITIFYTRAGKREIRMTPRVNEEGVRKAKNWKEKLFIGMVSISLVIMLVLPLISLGMRSITRMDANRGQRGEVQTGITLDYYRQLFVNERESIFYVPPIVAIRNSLYYGLITVIISVSLGTLAAFALNRPGKFNRWMDAVFMLPMGTSAVTLGLGFILVFNKPPIDIRTFPILLPIAHSLVAIPFVVRTLKPVIASIPVNLKQAASVLGASPLKVVREVDLPIIAKALSVSALFSFTISLGEFGATSFLARPEMPTIPVAIFRYLSQPGAANYGQAMAMATILMLVCTLSVLLMEWVDSNIFLRK